MAIDIGTYAIKDDLTAQFARMSAAALSFDKALGNTRGTKKMSDSLDALAKDALKPLREMAKAQERAAKEAAKRERDAQRQMRAEQAAAAAFIRAEQRKQAEIERTRRAQEKAAANTTWGRAKSAFGEAVSPRQMAIGAARTIGAGMISAPFAAIGAGFSLVEGIADKVIGVGKDLVGAVIDAAQFRQNAITGLEYMLGTREEAVKIFKEAQDLASETPLDTDKVITGIKQLVTAGFSGKEAMVLFKSVADQASKFADDENMQDKVIAAFSRVKGRGVATGEDLESFRVAGFRAEGIVDALLNNPNLAPLFKKVKVSGLAGGKTKWVDRSKAQNEEILKQVKEIMGEGKIGTYTLLNAAIASVEKDKPEIGEFAKRMGKVSLTGTISNFKSAFGDLLKSTDIDKWAGISGKGDMAGGKGGLQGFLTRITDALKGDVGKQLLGTIEKIVNTLLGGLDSIKESNIESFVKRIASLGESAVDVIKEAWGWLDRLLNQGDIGDDMADVLIDVAKYIGAGIWEGVKNAGSILKGRETEKNLAFQKKYGITKEFASSKASELGISEKQFIRSFGAARSAFQAAGGVVDFSQVREGTRTALMGGREVGGYSAQQAIFDAISRRSEFADQFGKQMQEVGKDGAMGMEIGARQELDSHSPSRTMARVGEDAAAGLVLGTEKGITDGRRQGGMGGIGNLTVNVNVGSVAGGDPTATANAIADITIERLMLAVMERKRDEG